MPSFLCYQSTLGFTVIKSTLPAKSECKTRCMSSIFTTGDHVKREQSVDKVGVEFYYGASATTTATATRTAKKQ